MSVQTEIDRIITAVQAAHEKVVAKGGTTAQPYLVGNLASAIDTIPTGSDPVLQAKTVTPTTAKQTIKPDSGYDGLSQVDVNAMPTATQATPSITVSSSGLITAKSTQSAGYVASGTKSATKQLTVQAAKTITPSTSQQTAVASGRYTTGVVTVAPIPSNYEDVTEETNAYTDKIASLESAVTALETELQGKASGGGSGGGSVETCTVTIVNDADAGWVGSDRLLIFASVQDANRTTQPFHAELDLGSIDIQNIVRGSTIIIESLYGHARYCTVTDSISNIEDFWANNEGMPIWLVQANGNGTVTLTV